MNPIESYILSKIADISGAREKFKILDLPCGHGNLIFPLKEKYPSAQIFGSDFEISKKLSQENNIIQADCSQPLPKDFPTQFDIVTSLRAPGDINNTAQFIANLCMSLEPGGTLILSNDNFLSVRDRVEYFLFGRFRRYSIFVRPHGPTFQPIGISVLRKLLLENKMEVVGVKYLGALPEDFLFLPLALPIFLFQFLYIYFEKSEAPISERKMYYSFSSLLQRHYVIVARKSN